MNGVSSVFTLIAMLIALGVAPVRGADTPATKPASREVLPGAKRVLFLGDSITYSGQFVDEIETHLRLRLPDRKFDILNVGLPSETVSGLSEEGHAGGKFPRPDLHERLGRILPKIKPDLVIACYGMNDGIYLPLSAERFAAFQKGMEKLHADVEAAGAKIIHVTPPVFDALPIRAKVAPADQASSDRPFEGYDEVLAAYSKWLVEQTSRGWQVIDLHTAMRNEIIRRRKKDLTFSFSKDGIHPNAEGHGVMAAAILARIGLAVDPADRTFGDPRDPKSRFALSRAIVQSNGRILIDAWLTEIGHKRPGMKTGMPVASAQNIASSQDTLFALYSAKIEDLEKEKNRLKEMKPK